MCNLGVQCVIWGYNVWIEGTMCELGVQCVIWGTMCQFGGTMCQFGGTVCTLAVQCVNSPALQFIHLLFGQFDFYHLHNAQLFSRQHICRMACHLRLAVFAFIIFGVTEALKFHQVPHASFPRRPSEGPHNANCPLFPMCPPLAHIPSSEP